MKPRQTTLIPVNEIKTFFFYAMNWAFKLGSSL